MNCSLVNCRLCMGSEEPEIAGGGGKGQNCIRVRFGFCIRNAGKGGGGGAGESEGRGRMGQQGGGVIVKMYSGELWALHGR